MAIRVAKLAPNQAGTMFALRIVTLYKSAPRGKSADHQSLLPQVQKDAQREWMKPSYQSRGAIT